MENVSHCIVPEDECAYIARVGVHIISNHALLLVGFTYHRTTVWHTFGMIALTTLSELPDLICVSTISDQHIRMPKEFGN